MKRIFSVALLALPLLVGSAQANGGRIFGGHTYGIQASGSFHIKGGPGQSSPQAGPWYLYWPMEKHFVAPAPTGYPYWPPHQGLPSINIGSLAYPPGRAAGPPRHAAAPPGYAATPPGYAATPPATTTPTPAQPAPQSSPLPAPQTAPSTGPQLQLPPYLQPTSYHPVSTGQPPSYWYDR